MDDFTPHNTILQSLWDLPTVPDAPRPREGSPVTHP
jgi:hypothetical protein